MKGEPDVTPFETGLAVFAAVALLLSCIALWLIVWNLAAIADALWVLNAWAKHIGEKGTGENVGDDLAD